MKKVMTALCFMALCTSVSASAKADTNGDGYFSREEMVAARLNNYEKRFHKADVNKDGRITMDELKGKRAWVAKAADADKDGVITMQEGRAHAEKLVDRRFIEKDVDKDGRLSKEERRRKKM